MAPLSGCEEEVNGSSARKVRREKKNGGGQAGRPQQQLLSNKRHIRKTKGKKKNQTNKIKNTPGHRSPELVTPHHL